MPTLSWSKLRTPIAVWSTRLFVAGAFLLLLLPASTPAAAGISDADQPAPAGQSTEVVHVKFEDGTDVQPPRGALPPQMRGSVRRIEPLFSLPAEQLEQLRERGRSQAAAAGMGKSFRDLPNLSLWFEITLNPNVDAETFLASLVVLPQVDAAELPPLPAPPPAVTPDFTADQGYLGPATDGIDAEYAWNFPGGNGSGVTIYDVEYSWIQTHEDLTKLASVSLLLNAGDSAVDPFNSPHHGTAVMGEVIADNNSFGVTGISWGSSAELAPANTANQGYNPANAILLAVADGAPGDVILIEQQTNVCGLPDGSYGPLEWVQSVFDAIQTAVAGGFVVVEAAGNGSVDLDQDGCDDMFDRSVRDSGAIIVGGGGPPGSSDRQRLGFSSYGSRVDVQGWGSGVTTTGYGFKYVDPDDPGNLDRWYTGTFDGTSSASPIVTGAAADIQGIAISELGPPMSSTAIRTLLVDTGSPQLEDTSQHIGPRPNLRQAIIDLLGLLPPDITVNSASVTVDEGDVAVNSGTFSDPNGDPVSLTASVASVVDAGGGTWSWSFATTDGPIDSQTVTITATDDTDLSSQVSFELIVNNVAPDVDAGPDASIDEGDTFAASGSFSDPGSDSWNATVDYGVSTGVQPIALAPDKSFSLSHAYGDDGVYIVTVTVTDDDGGEGSDTASVAVENVNPTADIDLSGATEVNGVPTFLASAGEPVDFTGQSADPGSDDLILTWNWADGTPDTVTTYLAGLAPDIGFPPGSPDVNPRDVTDNQSHTFGEACIYTIGFSAEDDDGGTSPVDNAQVLIAGTADLVRGAGYWQHQYRGNGKVDFGNATLECYLLIADHMSTVFSEVTDISSIDKAEDVLFVNRNNGSMEEIFDRQLLAAWLNFANGAIGLDELVDTDGDDITDTTFWDALQTAEAVRLDPAATRADLEAQKDILELINTMNG